MRCPPLSPKAFILFPACVLARGASMLSSSWMINPFVWATSGEKCAQKTGWSWLWEKPDEVSSRPGSLPTEIPAGRERAVPYGPQPWPGALGPRGTKKTGPLAGASIGRSQAAFLCLRPALFSGPGPPSAEERASMLTNLPLHKKLLLQFVF